jgi:hypothetical protein
VSNDKFITTTKFDIPDKYYVLREIRTKQHVMLWAGARLDPAFDRWLGPFPRDEAQKLKCDLNQEITR